MFTPSANKKASLLSLNFISVLCSILEMPSTSVYMQPDPQLRPMLGSALLRSAEAHEDVHPHFASSGCAFVDEAVLAGGFRYGEITALSGGPATGKKLV